jgi:SOS response associated peptidase (SRAP)
LNSISAIQYRQALSSLETTCRSPSVHREILAFCLPESYIREKPRPNAVTSAIHDRMPVILRKDDYDLWLDPGMQNVAAISELLKPIDPSLMRCYPVSSRVNHVGNDDEECSRLVELAQAQNRLFA